MQALRLAAATSAPAVPYPADTRAKGWTFELDYERIEQSDTWALATPDMRPWLLMVWLTAWRQAPSGSLPNDDELIAARIGMPVRQLQANRDILLRGWRLHEDGRLYHPVLVEQVLNMVEKREAEARRKQAYRDKKQGVTPNVPRDTGGIPPSATLPPPPPPFTSSSLRSEEGSAKAPPAPKPKAAQIACPEGVDDQVWSDWISLRKAKKAPITPTVIEAAYREASKAGMGLESFLRLWVLRGSQGLMADWIKPQERAQAMSFRERDQEAARELMRRVAPGLVRPPEQREQRDFIDMPVPKFLE
jgi:hypothetical protein